MAKPWHNWPPGLRTRILTRDNHTCQINLPDCTHHATQVDHITRPEDGGSWFHPSNLQAACKHCNVVKENWRRQGKHVYKPSPIWR